MEQASSSLAADGIWIDNSRGDGGSPAISPRRFDDSLDSGRPGLVEGRATHKGTRDGQRSSLVAGWHAPRLHQRSRRSRLHRRLRSQDQIARFLDPSVDIRPVARLVARQQTDRLHPRPDHGPEFEFAPKRTGPPWSIRIADAQTGKGREVWRAARRPRQRLLADAGRTINCSGWPSDRSSSHGSATAGCISTQLHNGTPNC